MAEAPRDRLPSGHDEEFVGEVDEDFHCLICQLALKQPVLTRCGHRFCKECLEEHFRRQEAQSQPYTCPADRESLERDRDVFPDKATERKILSLSIKCPSEGCEWNGELRNKEAHLASCPFKDVSCTNENCHVSLKRKYLKEHVTTTCEWRITECKYCTEPHPKCHMQDHIINCNKYPVPCPNKCGNSVTKEMFPDHIKEHCPLSLVSCPYGEMGCDKKVQRKNVESHLQSDMRRHLDLACVKVKRTEETTRKLAEKVERLQRQLEMKESNEVVVMEKTVNHRRFFIWKVKDFSKILGQAVSGEKEKITSAPFYTQRFGYKLKVGINFHFSRVGEHARLSYFLSVMKGEFYTILSWPVVMNVKITIIDQQENPLARRTDISKSETLTFPRPPTGREECTQTFFSMNSNDLEKQCYLVEDTLFLRVEISSP